MNTLQERLAKLAEHAPAGGAPPAELWARGKRAYRLRVAAVAATVMVAVAAAVASIGLGLSDGERHRSDLVPASTVGVSLPIGYPVSERLPDLGAAPGPLLAIWVTPRSDGAPEVVGLVAESGVFGTLPIDPWVDVEYSDAKPGVALSPDGRRIAYEDRMGARGEVLVVRDLVTGEEESPRIEEHGLIPYDWMDATHLYGLARGPFATGDAEGWVWEPGTAAKLVDFVDYPYPGHAYLGTGGPYGGTDLAIGDLSGQSQPCADPLRITEATDDPNGLLFEVPVLCDVVGVVGSEILLGHWNPRHMVGEVGDPKLPDGTMVALDIRGADRPYDDPAVPRDPDAQHAFDDPARRQVVVTAGAPHRVAFATGLVAEALAAQCGAS